METNKKLWVFSNAAFNKFMKDNGWNDNNIPEKSAFISICTPNWEDDLEYHWFKNNNEHVINLDFDDIDDYHIEGCDAYGLTNDQAKQLFKFIDNNIGNDFYIHCSAGVSRSQGVARFIMDYYYDVYTVKNTRKDNPCLLPNLHVVKLLRREWLSKYYGNNVEF